jgi:hypothetical protein
VLHLVTRSLRDRLCRNWKQSEVLALIFVGEWMQQHVQQAEKQKEISQTMINKKTTRYGSRPDARQRQRRVACRAVRRDRQDDAV